MAILLYVAGAMAALAACAWVGARTHKGDLGPGRLPTFGAVGAGDRRAGRTGNRWKARRYGRDGVAPRYGVILPAKLGTAWVRADDGVRYAIVTARTDPRGGDNQGALGGTVVRSSLVAVGRHLSRRRATSRNRPR